ncbi:hypothetical protein D3C81_1163140 [compost metagenome]
MNQQLLRIAAILLARTSAGWRIGYANLASVGCISIPFSGRGVPRFGVIRTVPFLRPRWCSTVVLRLWNWRFLGT